MPNFWWTGALHILKIQWFPLSLLIFGQKSCFLGPTIFKIPQPNWYYYIDMSLCTMLSYFCPYLISTMYIWTDFDLSWAVNLQIIVLSFAKLVLCQISCGVHTWINCFFNVYFRSWTVKIYLLSTVSKDKGNFSCLNSKVL